MPQADAVRLNETLLLLPNDPEVQHDYLYGYLLRYLERYGHIVTVTNRVNETLRYLRYNVYVHRTNPKTNEYECIDGRGTTPFRAVVNNVLTILRKLQQEEYDATITGIQGS